jgi:hypothetical protein
VVNAFSSLITMWKVWRMGETTPCKLICRPKPAPCSRKKNSKRVEVPIIVILLVARGQFKMSRFFSSYAYVGHILVCTCHIGVYFQIQCRSFQHKHVHMSSPDIYS